MKAKKWLWFVGFVAVAFLGLAILVSTVAANGQETCPQDDGWTKVEVGNDFGPYIDFGQTVEYCVKAGTSVYFGTGSSFTVPDGKDISHYSTRPVQEPPPCEGDECEPPPCEGEDCEPPPCEGSDCEPPPCEGDQCEPPPCEDGENGDCEEPTATATKLPPPPRSTPTPPVVGCRSEPWIARFIVQDENGNPVQGRGNTLFVGLTWNETKDGVKTGKSGVWTGPVFDNGEVSTSFKPGQDIDPPVLMDAQGNIIPAVAMIVHNETLQPTGEQFPIGGRCGKSTFVLRMSGPPGTPPATPTPTPTSTEAPVPAAWEPTATQPAPKAGGEGPSDTGAWILFLVVGLALLPAMLGLVFLPRRHRS